MTSGFAVRFIVLALASFGLAALVSSIVAAVTWRTPETDGGTAAQRADRLWRLRLLPAGVAISTCVFAVIGLWRFEARQSDEQLGWLVSACAVLGAWFMGGFVMRLVRMHHETRQLLATWLANASRIEVPQLSVPAYRISTHFPVVAVVGVVRPTLVVDASVLDACSPEELSAILAHEHGHLRRWDNLRRALFLATPDLLAWTRVGPTLRDAWREATEEAADDVAAEHSEETRMHLADALLHVARIAQGSVTRSFQAAQLPASALYRGESVERRVRRLLAPAEPEHPRRPWGVVAATAVVAAAFTLQRQLHDVLEVAVNRLW
jgi:beta-lactamase regulating signal transducer with metallopeptidase domain